MDDEILSRKALDFAKQNKQALFNELVAGREFNVKGSPVAIFMAGTPGAGKTEISKSLAPLFSPEPIRIDADEFREKLPGYNGANSHIVQSAASVAVDKVLDQVLDKKYPFILDGTFAVGKATVNLKRSIRRGYSTQITFVHQDPIDAWQFTKIREKLEGRHVPREAFIHAYLQSRKNIREVMSQLGEEILLTIIVKSYKTQEHKVYDNIDDIDAYLPRTYTENELKELLDD